MTSESLTVTPLDQTEQAVSSNPVEGKGLWAAGRQRSIVSIDEMTADVFRMSMTEQLVCETYVETGKIKDCIEACYSRYRRKISYVTVKKWLEKNPRVRKYIYELERRKGKALMTKTEWMGSMMDVVRNDREIQSTTPYMFKLIGEAKGWFPKRGDEVGGGIKMKNVQINILQSDGKA